MTPKPLIRALLFVFLIVFQHHQISFAATVVLTPVADASIRDSSAELNFGTTDPLFLGIALGGSPRYHGLLRFSLDSFPTNAVITGVSLQLVATKGPRPVATFNLNRLLKDWTEGEVTWSNRTTGSTWAGAGAQAGDDYVATPSAASPMEAAPSTNVFNSGTLLADVQLWQTNPAANFGWIISAAGGQAGTGRQVGSRENTTVPPALTLEYTVDTPPVPPSPPRITNFTVMGEQFVFAFTAESNRTYLVQFLDSLGSTNWSEQTNIAAQPFERTIEITNLISPFAPERYFQVGAQ